MLRSRYFTSILLICLSAFLFLSCSKDKEEEPKAVGNPSDRELMLVHYADEIVIPSYDNFKVKMDVMVSKSEEFSASPTTATLADLRSSWVDTYTEWQKVELFDFGPASNHALRNYFNIYPADVTGINAKIAALPAQPNFEVPAAYPQQGFPALDYLINGLGTSDDDILSFYTTAADAGKRIQYLQFITNQIKNKFNIVHTEWNNGFRNDFVSNTSMDMSGSTSLVVNGYVLNYERFIRSGKFGIPAGAMTPGSIFPDKVEAFYKKDISLMLAKTAHQASIDFYNGKSVRTGIEGPSLKTYLNGLGAKDSNTGVSLTETTNERFQAANAKMELLSNNFYNEVQTNNQAMLNVFEEMQRAVRLLKVDMTSAMSITITYTDNDGD